MVNVDKNKFSLKRSDKYLTRQPEINLRKIGDALVKDKSQKEVLVISSNLYEYLLEEGRKKLDPLKSTFSQKMKVQNAKMR